MEIYVVIGYKSRKYIGAYATREQAVKVANNRRQLDYDWDGKTEGYEVLKQYVKNW